MVCASKASALRMSVCLTCSASLQHSPLTGSLGMATVSLRVGAALLPAWPRHPPPAAVTILEDSLHVQSVGGTGLVVRAALQIVGKLPCPRVIDDPGICGADGIWKPRERRLKAHTCVPTRVPGHTPGLPPLLTLMPTSKVHPTPYKCVR